MKIWHSILWYPNVLRLKGILAYNYNDERYNWANGHPKFSVFGSVFIARVNEVFFLCLSLARYLDDTGE